MLLFVFFSEHNHVSILFYSCFYRILHFTKRGEYFTPDNNNPLPLAITQWLQSFVVHTFIKWCTTFLHESECSKTYASILRYKNRCAVVIERQAYLQRDPIGSGFLLHNDILFPMAVDPSPWWFPSLHLGTPMPPTGRLSWAAGI